jgi:protein-S-isoprenylcysteine O-methyltransferase Ste14
MASEPQHVKGQAVEDLQPGSKRTRGALKVTGAMGHVWMKAHLGKAVVVAEEKTLMRILVVCIVVLMSIGVSIAVLSPDEFNQRLLALVIGVVLGFAILRMAARIPRESVLAVRSSRQRPS